MNVYDLWLPILLSGLATHILSTLAWTVLPHHKPEWKRLPTEDQLHPLLMGQVPPGQYIFPFASDGKEAGTPAYQEKSRACSGMLIIWPGPTQMGKAIGLTLVTFMVIAFVIGYLASLGLDKGAEFMKVLQFVTTAGLLAHIAGTFPFVFWFRRKTMMCVLDGLAFALATGLIFASLWPR
jgi:hypothetical protein